MYWELEKIMSINSNLRDTFEEKSDYENALNEIYENFDGYFGVKTEFDEWTTNEDGEIIEHTEEETKKFYEKIWDMTYKIMLKKEFTNKIYNPKQRITEAYDMGFKHGLESAQSVIHEICG